MKNIFLIILVIYIAFSSSTVNAQLFFMDNTNVGKPAPDFTLKNLDGDDVNFNDYRDGQRAVIFFWSTWCPYCRKELKDLAKNKNMYARERIKILLVDVGEKHRVVERYIRKNRIHFEVLMDPRSSSNKIYDIVGLPTLFFVNKDGVVTGAKHSFPGNYKDILDKKFPQ